MLRQVFNFSKIKFQFKALAFKINAVFFLLIYISLLNVSFEAFAQELSSKEILDRMFASIKKVHSLTFTLKKKERIGTVLNYGEQKVKFTTSPKRVYTEIIIPNKGVELIYVEGLNNNMGYLNPNGFPYINLNLSPYSGPLRKGNHHTLHEVGFQYISDIVSHIYDQAGSDFNRIFLTEGSIFFENKNCYKLIIDYIPFKYIPYTVLPNETVTDIGYKLFISDYMILQLNKNIKDYEDVKAGQIIMVPTAYAKKTVLYIDKITNMPVVQMMYDEKGLIAQYEFHNLVVNPKIDAAEFTPEYEGYHFR